MNKIYKKVWNRHRGCFVAVSEAMTAACQKAGKVALIVGASGLLASAYAATDLSIVSSQTVSGNYGQLLIGGNLGTKELTASTDAYKNNPTGRHQISSSTTVDYVYDPWHRTPFKPGFHLNGVSTDRETFWNYWTNKALNECSSCVDLNVTIENGGTLVANKLILSQNTANTVLVLNLYKASYHREGHGGDGGYTVGAGGTYRSTQFVDTSSVSGKSHLQNNGGVLDVGTLDLCPTCTYTQESGTTDIDNITGDGTVDIKGGELITNGLLTINSAKAANLAVKDLNTLSALNAISYAAGTKASVGSLTAMADKVKLGNVTLKISGDYTQAIRDQATNTIQSKYGNGVNVQFTGNLLANSLDLSNGWTSEVLNSVFDDNGRADYLFHTLNWNAQGEDKVIGSGDIQKNFGVKNVENAGMVTVNNGKTFAILGENKDTTLAGQYFTADNGTLVFGADGLASGGQAGTVSVINNGTLKVASGDFTIDNLSADGNVNNTGSLRLNDFSFGENGRLSSSGTLSVDQDKMFEIENSHVDGLNVIGLGKTVPQNVRCELTELFRKYVSDNQKVLDEIVKHASFTGGKVLITNARLTTTQRDDLVNAFKSKFGSATEIVFQGTVEGVSVDDKLTVAKVNELYDYVDELKDVIYVDRKLEGENGAVTIGNSGLKNNTGFTGLNETTSTTIQDGKELTLIGAKADGTGTLFNMAENVIHAVGEGAKLILGSLGLQNSSSYTGQASEVNLTNGAELKVAAGEYKVVNHASDSGKTTVDKGATFNSDNATFTNSATFENNGTTTLRTLTGHDGVVNNNSKLTVEGETNFSGTLTNNANATLKGTATFDGTLLNGNSANLIANTVHVNGTLRNLGYMEAKDDSTVFGTLENPGEIQLYNTNIGNRGAVNNTYSLVATGTTEVAGLLANVAGAVANFTSDDGNAELVVLDGGTVSNNGTLIADSMTVGEGGYFINGDPAQTVSVSAYSRRARAPFANARAVEIKGNLTIDAGGNGANSGDAYYGTGTIAGTYTNNATGVAYGGVSSEFETGAGLTVTDTGVIHNAGTFVFGGSLANAGTIQGDGEVVFQHADVDTAANTFTNSGTIQVGTLTADNITYSQTKGTLTAANGWFANSEVNLTGGTLEHEVLGADNIYNLGLGSGSNDNATFTVGTLDSSSTVNINKGATLRTERIAMTGDKTTHLVGGRLSTTLDQVFSDLDYSALNLDATSPDDRVEIESNPQIVTGVGDVIDSVAQGIEFAWGTVAFDDASYSAALATDAVAKLVALGDVPADHKGELEVAFNGKAAEHFNVDLANSIKATLPDGTSAYATFANETLYNEAKDNPDATALVFGENSGPIAPDASVNANVIDTSMGFMQIVGASDGVYVNNGKHLVLVGKTDDNPNHPSIDLADGAVFVAGGDTSGDVVVPSKLTLGSYGTPSGTRGHLAELNIGVSAKNTQYGGGGGQVIVKNGVFTVDTLNNGSAGYGSDVQAILIGSEEDRTATLNVGTYTSVDAGSLRNEGVFHADRVATLNNANTLVNNNEFSAGSMDWTGKFTNTAQADIDDLTLRDDRNVNKEGATMTVGTLTVAGDDTSGDDGSQEIRGGLTNKGILTVQNDTTVEGDLINENVFTGNAVTVAGINGTFVNSGNAELDSLTGESGSTVSNAEAGLLKILGVNAETNLAGTLDNAGTIEIDGTQKVALTDGTLTNNGTIQSANENLSVEGGTLSNLGKALLNGISVTAGQIVNAVQAVFQDKGTTTVNTASAVDVAVKNEGALDVKDLQLLKGVIEGGTVGTKEGTSATVGTEGKISSENVAMKTLTNEGTMEVTGTYEVGTTENSGNVTIGADGTLVSNEGDVFTNKETGTLTSEGQVNLNGELINRGTTDIAQLNIGATGTLTAEADTALTNVNATEGATVNANNGAITVDNLTAEGAVYNQTGGTFNAEKGWFNNSTLNIMGGVLDASQVKDADGNVTGLLGKNVVNISGANTTPTINNEDAPEIKNQYKDNLTQVIAGTVTSDTTVNIMQGGVLDVENIDLDGTTADTINLKGGVLQTSADQIFGSVTTEAVRMDATDAETGTVQVPTTVLSATTVGAVKDSVKTGLNVESGNLALDDEWFSSSLIVSVADKLNQAFENAASLTVNFLGKMTAPFTITTANELEAEGLDVVLNPGIVLATTTLHNEFADEYNKDTDADRAVKGLVIGGTAEDPTTANSINISMGFKDITHADNVTIEGGKELALVGNAVNAIPDASFADDANKLLTDATDGGSININDGKFTFGTHGGVTPTVGWINSSEIGENGTLEAKNGEFADWTIANEGNVHVHDNAILHTNSYTGTGNAVNEGKLSLDEKDGTLPTFDVAGNFMNQGEGSELDASKVETTNVTGTLNNEGTANYADMVVAEGGTSDNSGSEQGKKLTVEGTHSNTGTSVWDGVEVAETGKGENAGTMDVGSFFDIAGEFINKGVDAVLDATKTAVTNVTGLLQNEGTANYDDMTIAEGGKSENSGTEKGDILTIASGGEHTNSGTSVWNNQTVQDGASATNEEGGKETLDGEYNVEGEKTNKGEVDATGVEETKVTGILDNQGTSTYDDMTIADGGVSDNSGYEKGDILTIASGGEHSNSGKSIWNNQTVQEGASATNEEGGKETLEGEYNVEGDKTNKGEVDATGVENTKVTGTLDNQGTSTYDDMTIADGGKSDNSGYEKGDILTVDEGGEHDNSGTSIWNNVVVAGGDLNNTGDIETEKLTVDDGTAKIDGGNLKADETDLNGGNLVIGNDREPTEENHVKAEINPKDDVIDTNIYVKNNGDLNLGPDGGLDWADGLGAPKVPGDAPSRLVVTTNVTTGPGGGIAVGPTVWTDKDNHVEIGNGDLYFSDGSVTVIPASVMADGKSAFNTTSDVAKVTVEPGVSLILGNIEEVGDYTIVSGYTTEGNLGEDGTWSGGWNDKANLYALPQDGSGINWLLTLHNGPSKIWVHAVLDDVRSVYPDIAVPNIANDDLLNCKSGDAGADFVCRILRDKELDVDGKTRILNSVANIAFAGGAMAVSMNDMNTAADSIEGRISMKGDAFTENGLMRTWQKGNDLWVDVFGGQQKYKSLSAAGIDKAGFKTNSYGLILGYDHKLENRSVIVGGAFSYNHGSLDSTGNVLKTKNKYDSFGLHAYSAWSPSERFNLIGTLSYMHNGSDITQTIGAAGFNKAEADVKTNMFSAEIRAESTFKVGKASVVPHVGLRYVYAKSGAYDTKVDGKKVWSNSPDATGTFQMPVGIAVRGDIKSANGWNIRPHADVTVIPQAGDTEQKTRLSNFNGVNDTVTGEFAGKFGTGVNLGVQADKGMATIGARYGFTGGNKGKADHAVKLEFRYRF